MLLYIFIYLTISLRTEHKYSFFTKMYVENLNAHHCPVVYTEFLSLDQEIKTEIGDCNSCCWFPTPPHQSPPLSSPEAHSFWLQALFHSHAQRPWNARANSHTGREKGKWLNIPAALSLSRKIQSCTSRITKVTSRRIELQRSTGVMDHSDT